MLLDKKGTKAARMPVEQVTLQTALVKSSLDDDLTQDDDSSHDDGDDNSSSDSEDSDGSDGSDGSDWDDKSLIDVEERVNAFSRVGATPALAAMVFNTAEYSLPRSNLLKQFSSLSLNGDKKRKPRAFGDDMGAAASTFEMRRSESDVCIQSSDYNSTDNTDEKVEKIDLTKPDDCLKAIFADEGWTYKTFSAPTLDGFFLEMAEENYAAYGNNIATAVRTGDLEAVQEHHKSGKTLQCCNKFQESILHTICRRSHAHLLEYVLTETDASIKIRDDYGRNPLHDAAWTHEPNFELVKLIIKTCPDLLLITDQRNFTPLAYVGKQRWEDWCKFLQENRELLKPRELL